MGLTYEQWAEAGYPSTYHYNYSSGQYEANSEYGYVDSDPSSASEANEYHFGDITKRIWSDITGKSNTAAQNVAAASLQTDAQAFNAAEAQKERDWQTQMSNTAYQRSVADLKAAGLNPWLAVGNGADTGTAAAASSGIAGSQASNVNALAAIGTAAAGIGILIKAIRAAKK